MSNTSPTDMFSIDLEIVLGRTFMDYGTTIAIYAVFYGIGLLLLCETLFAVRQGFGGKRLTAVMFGISILNFGIFTAQFGTQIQSFFLFARTALMSEVTTRPLADRVLSAWTARHPYYWALSWLGMLSLAICDAFVIWRAWSVLEKRRWPIILLAIPWIVTIVFAFVYLPIPQSPPVVSGFALASIILSMVTSALATIMYLCQLWTRRSLVFQDFREGGIGNVVQKSFLVVFDSGLFYSIFQIIGTLANEQTRFVTVSFAGFFPLIFILIVQRGLSIADLYGFNVENKGLPMAEATFAGSIEKHKLDHESFISE